MRGRLTLDKVNSAVNDMATYADANAQLIVAPKKKLVEDTWERSLELRDIAMTEAVKGKHFFLETDMKGPGLKLDNTGKAILTIHEVRVTEELVAFRQWVDELKHEMILANRQFVALSTERKPIIYQNLSGKFRLFKLKPQLFLHISHYSSFVPIELCL
ncbi:spindle and kinetochore-associated protein 1 homolog [Magnolia sinica]|uniref:spindle and kinetochore-associated protein 1 homolog n=1 Tax=Magnolia sinica TaxID=86752 RepID=UPI00265A1596|nr:spindle and kinetochore-associated protein 1 homolog [Magnolia sinica]